MYQNNKVGLFVIAALILGSCNQTNTPSISDFIPPLVDLPLKQEVIPFTYYTIDPDQGGSFKTERGTKVSFPASAFTYEDGSQVTEPVNIQFREYHSASEILLSGICMTAKNENGETFPFESAGMFDINGTCGDKKIKIAEGKTAQIQLANSKPDADFNFYKLAENGWSELQKNLPAMEQKPSAETKKQAEATLPVEPVAPEKASKDAFVFDLDLDVDNYPELKELYGMMWQYNGEKGSSTDPEKNKKITETDWTYSEVLRSGENFTLSLRTKKEEIKIPVKPVLSGKNYAEAKARYDKKMQNYQAALDQKVEAQKNLDIEGAYVRSLSVAGFGIYNCDRFYKMPQAQTIQQPMFTYNKKRLPPGTIIYHLAKEDVVIRVYDITSPFTYGKSEKNRFIAIFPDKTAAAVSATEFNSATVSTNAMFDFKRLDIFEITPQNLEKAIASI